MISHTIPDSPRTDTKMIQDFASVSSHRKKNGDFSAISVKERNCAAGGLEKWIITYRMGFLPLFVAV